MFDKEIDYHDISITTFSDFIAWLRTSYGTFDIIPMEEKQSKRSEKTINIILTCVIGFYEFLNMSEGVTNSLSTNTKIDTHAKNRSFKPFLHHISKSNPFKVKQFKLKESRQPIKTLQQNEIHSLFDACSNIRD